MADVQSEELVWVQLAVTLVVSVGGWLVGLLTGLHLQKRQHEKDIQLREQEAQREEARRDSSRSVLASFQPWTGVVGAVHLVCWRRWREGRAA